MTVILFMATIRRILQDKKIKDYDDDIIMRMKVQIGEVVRFLNGGSLNGCFV